MGGLFKFAFWAAPITALVVVITFYSTRHHTEEMHVQDAIFERDWNESMAMIAGKDPKARKRFEARALAAQRQISSAQADLAEKSHKLKKTESSIDQALEDIEKMEGAR